MSAAFRLLSPPLLWAAHFLAVYIFVSLACLWSWHHRTVLGLPVVELVVALATLAVAAGIAGCGLAAFRQRGFYGRVGFGVAALFGGATLLVGLPTLLAPTCR
jgi:hypothetical protein